MKKCIILSRVSTNQQDLVQQTNALIAKAKAFGYNDNNIELTDSKTLGLTSRLIAEADADAQLIGTIEDVATIIAAYVKTTK